MKIFKIGMSSIYCGGLFVVLCGDVRPAMGQSSTVIPNTATAEFNSPGKPPRSVPSNTVKIQVQGGVAALEILKIGDRASVEPGDALSYRLQIRNTGTAPITDLQIKDTLPLGFKFLSKSPVGAIANAAGSPVTAPSPLLLRFLDRW